MHAPLPPPPPASRAHLVHVERRSDSVARAMAVIEALAPQGRARECIESAAGGTLGEHSLIQSDVALREGGAGEGGRGREGRGGG